MNDQLGQQVPETTLWSGTPSKRVAGLAPLTVAAAFVASWFYAPQAWFTASRLGSSLYLQNPDMAALAPFLFAALIVAIFLYGYFFAVTTQYECTSERLIIRKGLFVRTEDEIELYRVIDVVQGANIFQMLMGVGHVTVKNTDQTGTTTIASITSSAKVRNVIRTAAEQCKARRVRVFAE